MITIYKFSRSLSRYFLAVSVFVCFLGVANTAYAAVRTSTATGGNWSTGGTWVGGVAPANGDSAIIATTGGNSVTIGANTTNTGVTVNSGAILNFTGAFTLTENGNVAVNGSITGATGIIRMNAANLTIDGSGSIGSIISVQQNISFPSTASLTINNDIQSNSRTVTNNGTVTFNNYVRQGGTVVWVQGTNAVANISGAFTPAGNVTLTANASGNIINYDGAAQAVQPAAYVNLIFSGSGAKSIVTGTSVTGTLSIAATGTATASVGAGLTIPVANLTLGGLGRVNGTWGSTSSAATNKNNTYFAATTGVLNVTNDTRATPTLSVTNSPVTYNATPQSAIVSGSVSGVVSNIKYNGSATAPTNAATYAITADFAPTDATSYKSLTAAGAGNFVIGKATPTLSVTNPSVTYNASPQAAAVVGSVPGTVSNVKYNGSATVPTNVADYAVTADFVPTDSTNYSSLTGASAGNFVINKADQTIIFNTPPNKTLGDADFPVSASASSGLAVSFSSLTTSVCTVSGNTVHLVSTGTCTIRASQAGDANYNPAANVDRSFTVLQAATKFVIIQPAAGIAGTPVTVTVEAQKAHNSVDTSYQQDVTLTATGSAAGAGLVNIVNGVGTENISDTVAETVTLGLSDTQNTLLDVTSTQQLTFAPGPVAKYLLSDPGNMFAKSRLGYTVTRQDAFENAVTVATSTIYLYTTSTGGTAKFYSDSLAGSVIASIDIDPGHSSANFWYFDATAGTWVITASDNATAPDGAAGIADASDPVTVFPVATKFIIVPPASGTVDSPITITVEAVEPDNSIDTNYQQDVTLNVSGSAIDGGLVSIINGIGTRNVSDTVAETVTLSLTDSESTGLDVTSTQLLTFAPGATAQFTLSHPGTLVAGERAPYTVTRKDQFGNDSTAATSTVYLYSSSTGTHKQFFDTASDGNIITSVVIGSGAFSADFWYADHLPGTWTITASDNQANPDGVGGVNDAIDTIVVTSGPVAAFLLNNPGNMTAGTRLEYAVTRVDAFNNLVSDGVTTAYLYSNSSRADVPAFFTGATGGSPVASVSIPDGQSSVPIWYFDPNTGTWTVTVSDNASAPDGTVGITDASDEVTVNAAPIVATRFVILPPTNGTVDASIPVTIQAQDNSGNIDTTYQMSVTLVTTGSATGGGLVAIVNGVGTLAVSDTVAQTVQLSLVDSEASGLDVSSTRAVSFRAGVPAQLQLSNPGDVAAGSRVGYTVSRKDQFGNDATSGATAVYLYSTSDGVNKRFFDAASGGSAITSLFIPNGQSSASFWYRDEKAGAWFVSVSDNAVSPDGVSGIVDASDAITVEPGAAAKFMLNDPGDMSVGTRLAYAVSRADQFDNPVTSGVMLAYLYSSSTGTTTAFYSVATGGAPTAFATINDGSASGDFWYFDEKPGAWLITASDSATSPNGATGVLDAVDSVTVSSVPIVATRLVILPVDAVQIGTPATVTVQAEDEAGNVDTTYQTGVTLLASGSATGVGIVHIVNGIGTSLLLDTTAEIVTLSLSDSEHSGLNVSSTQTAEFSAVPVSPATAGGAGRANAIAPAAARGVQISGRAFPKADVQVLAASLDGTTLSAETTAAGAGSFSLLMSGVGAGVATYAVVGIDALGRTTQTRTFNANRTSQDALISLDAGLLSPTLGLVHPTVRKGDVVGFVGSALPGATVSGQIDGTAITQSAVASNDGSFKISVPTGALAAGSHSVRVRQTTLAGTRSELTPQKVFTVTTLFTPQTDFNQDGIINVQDWSVFLARWNSEVPAVRQLDDLNNDGTVDVTDLSIFVRTLKK